jgi:hypothetical protein
VSLVLAVRHKTEWAIFSFVACPDLKYLVVFLVKEMIFREEVTEHKMCVLSLGLKLFSFQEEFSWMLSKMYKHLHVSSRPFLTDLKKIRIF